MIGRRIGRATLFFFGFVGLAMSAVQCASVPSLTFAPPDAALGDGVEGAADVLGPIDGGCPDVLPDGASVCCGEVACTGDCTPVECAMCELNCGPAKLCCAKPGTVMCKAFGSGCP